MDKNIVIITDLQSMCRHIINGEQALHLSILINLAINFFQVTPDGGKIIFKTVNEFIGKNTCNSFSIDLPHSEYLKLYF